MHTKCQLRHAVPNNAHKLAGTPMEYPIMHGAFFILFSYSNIYKYK